MHSFVYPIIIKNLNHQIINQNHIQKTQHNKTQIKKMTTTNTWQMKGKIYVFDMQNKTVAFTNDTQSDIVMLYIGGLGDTLLSTPFTSQLSSYCTAKGIKLIIPQFRSMPNYRTFLIEDDIDDLDKIVQQQSGKRVILLGHSTGCQVSMLYISKHAEKITQVFLQAPVSDVQYQQSINPNLQVQLKQSHQTQYFASPTGIWLSARFLSLYERHNTQDLFSTHLDDEYYLKWRSYKSSITSIVCELDEYVVKSNVEKLRLGSEVFVIQGASHALQEAESKKEFFRILDKQIK